MSALLLLEGLLFQIPHDFLMLPLHSRGSSCIGGFGFPDPGCLDDFCFAHGSQTDGLCLTFGSPVGSLSMSNCGSIPSLYFSDSLRSVNFILALTDFCF